MQQISDIAHQALEVVQQNKPSTLVRNGCHQTQITDEELAKFWLTMAHTYGARWKQYGLEPSPVWVKALRTLSRNQLQRGIERCIFGEPLPDLPTFITYCTASGEGPQLRATMPRNYRRPALCDPNAVLGYEENMRKIREMLGIRRKCSTTPGGGCVSPGQANETERPSHEKTLSDSK